MLNDSKATSSFSVNDLQKAKEFYENKLGLKVSEANGMMRLNVNGGNPIMVYPKPDHTPASFTVLNFPVQDVEKTVDELTAKGVTFEHYPSFNTNAKGIVDDPRGPKIAWFKDPAGNVISVMQER